ncbi:MAG: DUF2752 domain-containing protein [Planctomycetota bacterium]|jgi:hypothetical protein
MEQTDKQVNKKIIYHASKQQRLVAALIFLSITAGFVLLLLMSREIINTALIFGPCGFKQRYALPCPSCGMTTGAVAFVQGRIWDSFYIQPAGAFLCSLLVISAFLAFLTAVFGVYFGFLKHFFKKVKIGYVIITFLIIISSGWIVTLARALAVR